LEFFNRSKAEYSREMGPTSADAAAALETAKRMRDTAVKNQIASELVVKRMIVGLPIFMQPLFGKSNSARAL
jgi:hypothetical protein